MQQKDLSSWAGISVMYNQIFYIRGVVHLTDRGMMFRIKDNWPFLLNLREYGLMQRYVMFIVIPFLAFGLIAFLGPAGLALALILLFVCVIYYRGVLVPVSRTLVDLYDGTFYYDRIMGVVPEKGFFLLYTSFPFYRVKLKVDDFDAALKNVHQRGHYPRVLEPSRLDFQ